MEVVRLARRLHIISRDLMFEKFKELNPGINLPPVKSWNEASEQSREHYIKMAEKLIPERAGNKFQDKGPWEYGVDLSDNRSPRHFVQSEATGENFDDVRLYINGNMTQEQYVNYGYDLAEFLNTAVQPKDNCENCQGEKGGVPGNENIVNGKVLCDYCS